MCLRRALCPCQAPTHGSQGAARRQPLLPRILQTHPQQRRALTQRPQLCQAQAIPSSWTACQAMRCILHTAGRMPCMHTHAATAARAVQRQLLQPRRWCQIQAAMCRGPKHSPAALEALCLLERMRLLRAHRRPAAPAQTLLQAQVSSLVGGLHSPAALPAGAAAHHMAALLQGAQASLASAMPRRRMAGHQPMMRRSPDPLQDWASLALKAHKVNQVELSCSVWVRRAGRQRRAAR